MSHAERLICPVCSDALTEAPGSLRCPRGHLFDRAREGYVDLLPHGHGRSKIAGDTKDMLRARQRFLERGHYEPLARRIRETALDRIPAGGVVLEVGAGSGYFIGALAQPPIADAEFYALDVSRAALRMAARAWPEVFFFLNDVHHRICMADGSVHLLLDVFAPRNPNEFSRVVRPGGLLLVVIPGEHHLKELREHVPMISIEAGKEERTTQSLAPGFALDAEETLEHTIQIAGEETADALRMTPSAFHLTEADLAVAAALPVVRVTASFRLLQFRRL